MEIVNLKEPNIPMAWKSLLYNIASKGRSYKIDCGSCKGSYRIQLDFVTILITHPWSLPLIPDVPEGVVSPVSEEFLYEYSQLILEGNIYSFNNYSYTYGERLNNAKLPNIFGVVFKGKGRYDRFVLRDMSFVKNCVNFDKNTFSQFKGILELIKRYGPNNNQMVLQVAQPSDIFLLDPPCLRQVDIKVIYGKIVFYVYFRSWDAYFGFPTNIGALELLKQYLVNETGLENGEIICISSGAHIYETSIDCVEAITKKKLKIKKEENGS